MSETILVALGGNALIRDEQTGSFEQQIQNARAVAARLVDAIDEETRLILAHGNGPQVGNLHLQNELSGDQVRKLPLFGSNASSQGLIGSMLSLAFNSIFSRENLSRHAVPILTPVIVERDGSRRPTKPIGPFYTAQEAKEKEGDEAVFKEDAGRGWRRVVPSPKPKSVALADQIIAMLDNGNVPIVTGGGGLPVVKNNEQEFEYINGVVDKDLAAAQIADQIDADRFVILTDVQHVLLNYGTNDETALCNLDSEQARKFLSDGEFARGSMYEKVEAACEFIESGDARCATITSLEQCREGIHGNGGTQITATD